MDINEEPPSNDSKNISQISHSILWYRATIDLLKAFTWPIIIISIFFSIKVPLISSLEKLPSIIESANKMTVGTVSIERSLQNAGIPLDVRQSLARLSRGGLIFLLRTANTGFHYLDTDWKTTSADSDALQELEREKLIIEKTRPDEKYPFKYTPTLYAKSAYEIVLHNVILQLGESAEPK